MDESFRQTVVNVSDLYSRPIVAHEQIWSLDEKTSLQPRTRSAPNLPPQPDGVPIHVEHEYERKGAAQLFRSDRENARSSSSSSSNDVTW
jgi:hypothetical protein